jgi:hypothetical protein
MNKKLFTIAIALVIFAIVVAPVAAKMPSKNPWPQSNPCNSVWALLQDLQNQINALTTKVNSIPAGQQGPPGPTGPTGPTGPAGTSNVVTTSGYENSGTNSNIAVPNGFTTDQCHLILSPAEVSCPDGYYVGSYFLNFFPSLDKNSFNLLSGENCWEASNPSVSLNTKGFGFYYLMVCTS